MPKTMAKWFQPPDMKSDVITFSERSLFAVIKVEPPLSKLG